MKKRWIIAGALLAVVAAGVVAIWPEAKEIYEMKKQERQLRNLETEVVRIELAGQHFNIPMRYLYGQAIEKHRQWPKAKKERVKVDALTLSVLLPDMRPYYPEDDAKWKVRGHGDRVEVTIMKFRGPPKNWGKRNEINIDLIEKFISEGRFYKRSMDVYDLIHYTDANKQPYNNGDIYFARDREMRIDCDAINPPSSDWKGFYSPSCKVATDHSPGIVLEYYYGINHLPSWREIDDGLKSMFDKLSRAAQSESTNKEE